MFPFHLKTENKSSHVAVYFLLWKYCKFKSALLSYHLFTTAKDTHLKFAVVENIFSCMATYVYTVGQLANSWEITESIGLNRKSTTLMTQGMLLENTL